MNDEYTPRTEDIQHVWVSRTNGEHSWASLEESWEMEAEFDRWLVAHEAEIKQQERARIIALLHELDVIRRDALGDLVAYNTDGTEVIYLTGLEGETE